MRALSNEVATASSVTCDISDAPASAKYVADENWFSVSCLSLYNGKAGTALHYETGFDERSCQRYAAGQVKPPAYFLRELLRSEHGGVWLAALMEGSNPQWWRQLAAARKLCSEYWIELKDT